MSDERAGYRRNPTGRISAVRARAVVDELADIARQLVAELALYVQASRMSSSPLRRGVVDATVTAEDYERARVVLHRASELERDWSL